VEAGVKIRRVQRQEYIDNSVGGGFLLLGGERLFAEWGGMSQVLHEVGFVGGGDGGLAGDEEGVFGVFLGGLGGV
jgi:hypothetical protein